MRSLVCLYLMLPYAQGRWIEIPDDKNGGMRWIRLRAWIVLVCADFPAAQSLLPFVCSASAYIFCRGCDIDQSRSEAGRPFSFLKKSAANPAGIKRGCCPAWRERDWPELREKLSKPPSAQRNKELTAHVGLSLRLTLSTSHMCIRLRWRHRTVCISSLTASCAVRVLGSSTSSSSSAFLSRM